MRAAAHAGLAALALTYASPVVPQEALEAEHGPLWLEETYGVSARKWAELRSAETIATFAGMPQFRRLEAEAAAVLTSPGRIPEPMFHGDHAYAYWQDEEHPLGLWRRTSRTSFFSGAPRWTTLLDLDALSARERRRWIFDGASCRGARCLLRLSDNGKDAGELREFDLERKAFVSGGFFLPEGKGQAWWFDADTLLVAPIYGDASTNEAGYPRTLRLWTRGTLVGAARTVFEGKTADASLGAMAVNAGETGTFIAIRHLDFDRKEYALVDTRTGAVRNLPLPKLADLHGEFQGQMLLRLNAPWVPVAGERTLSAGTLVGLDRASLVDKGMIEALETLYVPAGGEAVRGTTVLDGRLIVNLLRNYRSAALELTSTNGRWEARALPLERDRYVSLVGEDAGKLLVRIEAPLVPERLSLLDIDTGKTRTLYQREPAFDARKLTAEIVETHSRDGTPISYTLIRPRGKRLDGSDPTLIYGYGGYDVPVTPRYEPIFGKLWMDRGGTYVHAYLRGGGENGPAWHRGAMRQNRQQAYDDMAAIIEDLHRRRITRRTRTGIMGRSNGGLMVSVMMQQRPDLVNAALIGGPLTDMLNFHELGPGASWTAEYGDPRDPAMRSYLAAYSPMQNIRTGVPYPAPLIITSTNDDRVLPGQARRFAYRLNELGQDAHYFEDGQGGHYWELAGGPAPGDWRLRAFARAIEFSYFWSRLSGEGEAGR